MFPHDATKAARGIRAARIGAVAGLVPAVGLSLLRILNGEPPQVVDEVIGNIAFTLVYASPYLLALMASRARDPGVRGGLLVALGLLSLVASFSTLSLVTVVLLPATFVLWFAAARSLAASGRPLVTSVPAAAVGLFMAATVGLGFFALWGIQDDEARAAMGIGAVGAALLTMLLVSRLRWPRGGHQVRTAPPLCAPTPPG